MQLSIQDRAKAIVTRLSSKYTNPPAPLAAESGYMLFVAVILAARYADKQVNSLTPRLASIYPSFADLAAADKEALQDIIRDATFAERKAENLIASAKIISKEYGGALPHSQSQLENLPGIGRKSANMIMVEHHGIPALPVDTHVSRIAWRTGLVRTQDPIETERTLCLSIPKEEWKNTYRTLIMHGKETCTAIEPQCSNCIIHNLCKLASPEKEPKQLSIFDF